MARRVRLSASYHTDQATPLGARAWVALSVLLIACALLAWPLERSRLDWQPALAAAEPWRAFSAAFVHLSTLHLGANVAGAALVGALGWAAAVPLRSVVAWLVAWPLTQVALLLQPALAHYAGLSGVLHAGAAVVAVHLAFDGAGLRRGVGVALLAGLLVKVLGETPWAGPLRFPAGWDIAVAPLAHASGAAAGTLASALAEWWARRRATHAARRGRSVRT